MLDEMPTRNLVSWTSTISSFIRSGHAELALREFSLMCSSGLRPNEFGFSSALKASRIAGETAVGKLLHGCTIKSGFESSAFCSTSILHMYAKCGNMGDARKLFDGVPLKCEALWNTLIDGCTRSSDPAEAITLFHQMLLSDSSPNSFTYTILVNSSTIVPEIDQLRFFHARTMKAGFEKYEFVGGALVDAYAKWGELSDACRVFRCLEDRDHVVWSALLAGVRHNGDSGKGLDLYLQFISEGYRLDPFLFASVFNLCADLGILELGLQVHCCLTKSGFALDTFVGSAIVDMYASFGLVADAHGCFLDTTEKNEVIFGAMIHGFVSDSDYRSAIELVSEMSMLGLEPDYSTLNCIVRAYANLDMLEQGRVVHGRIVKTVGESDLIIGNNLLEMYSRCKAVDEAAKVFVAMEVRNEFSWTGLISGYIESERYEDALELFRIMQSSSDSVRPNQFTLVAILQAISKLAELRNGEQAHGFAIKLGFHSHAYIESALIGMYSKCGRMDDASLMFSSMTHKDLVSCSTMISAFVQHGHGEEALKLFSEYQIGLIAVDESVLSSCLAACSSLTALEMGRCIHVASIKTGFESDSQVVGAIIDMYCKCGSIGDARRIFDTTRGLNVVCYTAMVAGYAQHGLGHEALHLFDGMQVAGIEPDDVTFIGVLTACNHFGLVKEGWHYFESMKECGLERTIGHYACMVDLLGRVGQVNEAEELIKMAPFSSKTSLWRSLLGACSKHGNIEVGNRVAEMLIRLEPNRPSNYVLLSNIYASAFLWDQSIEMKNKIEVGCMRKTPGCSWIEVTN